MCLINFFIEVRHVIFFSIFKRERMRGEGESEIHFQSYLFQNQ